MRRDIYRFLKECALEEKTIKEACEEQGVNPGSVRKFLRRAEKNRFLRHRVVRKGRNLGFRYDGVVVFWDRVEIEERRREREREPAAAGGLIS